MFCCFYFSIIRQDICAYDVVLADVFRLLLRFLFLLEINTNRNVLCSFPFSTDIYYDEEANRAATFLTECCRYTEI